MKDFFQQARIKKLRKIPGGDTYVVIYLKMMLLSINSNGVIIFESIEPTFEEELALTLDEDIDAVKVLVAFLAANNLIEQKSNCDFFMVEVSNLIGSETSSTQRSRKSREKQKLLHCNTSATNSNTEKSREELELTTTTINNINKKEKIETQRAFQIYTLNFNYPKNKFLEEWERFYTLNPNDESKTVENWNRWCFQIKKNQKGQNNE